MINSRTKGHSYERKIVQEFKDLGYDESCTSRAESRNRDNQKVDLCNTGNINVQCKAVEKGINYHKLLSQMPKEEGRINTVFHKRDRKEVVSLSKKDFYKLIS